MLHGARKNILLGVKKVKISLQSPETEFGAQNQYDRVTYPSTENFTWSKKNDDLNCVVVSNADCYSKGPGFESRVSHGPFQKVKHWIANPSCKK
jgi:hypothetical protein